MKWSWRIGKVAGIGIYVHFTFVFLLLWIAIAHYSERKSLSDVGTGLGFVLLLFLIIVLHELGHALAAKRYGIGTKDITLLPIGGLARMERIPEKPAQELVVAIAGPAVNVALAALLFGILTLANSWTPLNQISVTGGTLMERLLAVNVLLAVFNMIPAFPMDGGRVLRALLAMRLEYVEATRIAAGVGQAFALLIGVAGLFFNPFWVFIALFVWLGAAQESHGVEVKAAIAGVPIERLMITRFETLRATDPLEVAVGHVLDGFQIDFPVVDEGSNLVGVLTRSNMLKALAQREPNLLVQDAMERDYCTADISDPLETALSRLQEGACSTVPVLRDGHPVGLLTMENLGEFLLINQAIRR